MESESEGRKRKEEEEKRERQKYLKIGVKQKGSGIGGRKLNLFCVIFFSLSFFHFYLKKCDIHVIDKKDLKKVKINKMNK